MFRCLTSISWTDLLCPIQCGPSQTNGKLSHTGAGMGT
jgi:hypothetical protein